MASFKMVNEITGESIFKKDGKVTATNTRVLSTGRQDPHDHQQGHDGDGKPRNDMQVFEKDGTT
jgi:hypothetical protein